jgi:hypothetical protein
LADNRHGNGQIPEPAPQSEVSENVPDQARKNRKITNGHKDEAEDLGMIANWSHVFGFVSLRDPVSGEWHELQTKEAPGWSLWEARKRKELYGDGNQRAYRLTSRQMEEIWETEQPRDEGIVEEHPPEEADPYL